MIMRLPTYRRLISRAITETMNLFEKEAERDNADKAPRSGSRGEASDPVGSNSIPHAVR